MKFFYTDPKWHRVRMTGKGFVVIVASLIALAVLGQLVFG